MSVLAHARTESRTRPVIRSLRDFILVLTVAALIGGAIFMTAFRRMAFIGVGYEIRSLQNREAELVNVKKELEIEKAMLSSPERIERVARERLGMIEAEAGQIRIVR